MTHTVPSYHYHVQTDFEQFWATRGCDGRRVLFIFGLGFDPRCVPAFRAAAKALSQAKQFDTLCLRFKNPEDGNILENTAGTVECLTDIEAIYHSLPGARFRHDQLEVNLFDSEGGYEGHRRLVSAFTKSFAEGIEEYTDVVVDISAFPRSLMYAVLTHLRRDIKPLQNLFAVLCDVPVAVDMQEEGYSDPHYIVPPSGRAAADHPTTQPVVWIPVLGGAIERLGRIYDYLRPKEVFPIVPFPTRDPRAGDQIVLRSRQLFDDWRVPFTNLMYGCGDVPFDIYRKIHDIVERYRSFMRTDEMVVSALSGRSLSLGVLLAAWQHDLPVCQIQPKTYRLASPSRDELRRAAYHASVTLFWLTGEIYQ